MKRSITLIFVVIFVVLFAIVSASAQGVQPIPMGDQNQTPTTTSTPATKIQVLPVPQGGYTNSGSVTRTRVMKPVTIKKYYMNGVDKDARIDIQTLKDTKVDVKQFNELVTAVNQNTDDIQTNKKGIQSNTAWIDLNYSKTFWMSILIPAAILVLTLILLAVFRGSWYNGVATARATAHANANNGNGNNDRASAPVGSPGPVPFPQPVTPNFGVGYSAYPAPVNIDINIDNSRTRVNDDYYSSIHYTGDGNRDRQPRENNRRQSNPPANQPSA